MKSLPFTIPFSGFCGTTFINCFASTYMFLENIVGDDGFECKKRDRKPCDSCGNCRNQTSGLQEGIFFLFDTMCGRSSLRCRFDGEPTEMQKWIGETEEGSCGTDDTVDFLFGFAGYAYNKVTADFQTAIVASIDAGRPVIAKVNSGENRFRVITGYDGGKLLSPEYKNVQKPPKRAPKYEELEALYVVGEKVAPKENQLRLGLQRIEQVMERSLKENLWDEYAAQLKCWGDTGLCNEPDKEVKRRFKRAAETMWHAFNCHNFAETFRHCVHEELRDPALTECWANISFLYDDTHTRAWSIIHLEQALDWSKRPEWGTCEIVPLVIEKMKQNDIGVLAEIRRALRILHQKLDCDPSSILIRK